MDIVNDLFKYNNPLIKYMGEVEITKEEYDIFKRYRVMLEILREFENEISVKDPYILRLLQNSLGLSIYSVTDMFKEKGNPIVHRLKLHAIYKFIDNKGM